MPQQNAILEEFEIKGHWWVPERPNKRVPGILFYRSGDIRLELMGSLTPLVPNMPVGTTDVSVVHGTSEYGEACTLLDSVEVPLSIALPALGDSDVNSEVLPNQLFVGDYIAYFDKLRLSAMFAELTHFEDWLGLQPFGEEHVLSSLLPQPDGYTVPVAYDWREIVQAQVPARGLTVSIVSSVRKKNERFKSLTLRHVPLLVIKSDQPADYWTFWNTFVEFRTLLTILIGVPVYPTEIQTSQSAKDAALAESSPSPTVRVYHRSSNAKRSNRTIWPYEMPIPFSVIGDQRMPDVLRSWFGHAEKLAPVYDLFAEIHYDHFMKVETEFLRLTQALEVLHRRVYDGTNFGGEALRELKTAVRASLPAGFGQTVKDELLGRLDYINEYSLGQRLRALLSGLSQAASGAISAGSSEKFVRTVVDTRNHLVHFGPPSKYALTGYDGFLHFNKRLRALLLLLLCDLIGIPEHAATERTIEVFRLRDEDQ